MFIEVAISEEDRGHVIAYSQRKKIRLDRAYAELLRAGLANKTGWATTAAQWED